MRFSSKGTAAKHEGMKFRIWLSCLATAAAMGSLRAAETRAELMFVVHSALQTGNRKYLEQCFQWDEADPASRGRARAIIDEILRWRAPHLGETDRDTAAMLSPAKLNGEWTFQIHFHNGPPPSTSFVFPAGRVGYEMKILLASPVKSSESPRSAKSRSAR